jgi:ABC-type spermidine/putrescine transport system permease subunit II
VVATALWQACTIGLVAVMLGVPIGIMAGRWAWNLLNDQLATAARPVTPIALIAVIAAAIIAAVGLLGLGPGLRASRQSPATALRTE